MYIDAIYTKAISLKLCIIKSSSTNSFKYKVPQKKILFKIYKKNKGDDFYLLVLKYRLRNYFLNYCDYNV